MNMNTTTRLEDRVNAVLIVVAICGMLGLGLSTAEGSALSRDGAGAAAHQAMPSVVTLALVATR
jgi:membrane-associated PAP2 superfamily phosphatase